MRHLGKKGRIPEIGILSGKRNPNGLNFHTREGIPGLLLHNPWRLPPSPTAALPMN
jgi:hypothetical protein